MKFLVTLALCLFSLIISIEAFGSGINSIVSSLPAYQNEQSGGFQITKRNEPSLEATYHAILLSSLFGLTEKVDLDSAQKYISELRNANHGYSPSHHEQQADLRSTRNALAVMSHLGWPLNSETVKFVDSLYDTRAQLFSNVDGEAADYQSTALAFECYELLNVLDSEAVLQKKREIKEGLGKVSQMTSENHWRVVVASYVGYEFDASWSKYFSERQVTEGPNKGAFYSDAEKKSASIEDSACALNALYHIGGRKLVDTAIDVPALIAYSNVVPTDLTAATHAFTALARTTSVHDLFKFTTNYPVRHTRFKVEKDRIIQGTHFKQVLNARANFGLPHASLDVSLTITHVPSGEVAHRKLSWDAESALYTTDEYYDTKGKLGDLTLDYTLKWRVPTLGEFAKQFRETKKIGFDFSLKSDVKYKDQSVAAGGKVGPSATFDMQVSLGTVERPLPQLESGDFQISLEVLDSSRVVVHTETHNGKSKGALKFVHTLGAVHIPVGSLFFRFTISSDVGVHTVEEISYNHDVEMVAADVTFLQTPSYKLGQSVQVKMQPATMIDLHTIHPYGEGDRKFVMDVLSEETRKVLFSVDGKSSLSGGVQSYTFSFTVLPNFDFLGANNILSFRYVTASGKEHPLQSYDSHSQTKLLDGDMPSFSVQTDLRAVQFSNGVPKDGELSYGDNIYFTFQVKDSVTGVLVGAGADPSAAYFVLRNTVDGVPVMTAKQAAVYRSNGNFFSVRWSVNPNAISGEGTFELVAQGRDDKEVPLKKLDGQQWQVKVTIGGEITSRTNIKSGHMSDEDRVFYAGFELSCKGRSLDDAELVGKVRFSGGKTTRDLGKQPVGVSGTGKYEVSWIVDTATAKGGDYTVDIYREVDIQREKENEKFKAQPLFSFTHGDVLPFSFPLPFKFEFVLLVLLFAGFLAASIKKMEIEGKVNRSK